MIDKNKLDELKAELYGYGLTSEDMSKAIRKSHVTLKRIFDGKTYDAKAIRKLIAMRDEKRKEVAKIIEALESEKQIAEA